MKFITIAALLVSAVAVSAAVLPVQPKHSLALPEDQNQNVESPNPVLAAPAKSYVVVFKESAASQAILNVERDIVAFGGKIGWRYTTLIKGFSAWIPAQVVIALSNNPAIDYIEEDSEVTTL
ncbi:hypothetical protein BGX27_004672 [Mortierella sp. AM989]|nr:hypothetical protein BGX27_004672 [Mortierella sp. AM989]